MPIVPADENSVRMTGEDRVIPSLSLIPADTFRCPDCAWVGTENEMLSDFSPGGEGYSNHICPNCGMWWRLTDYERPEDSNPSWPAGDE